MDSDDQLPQAAEGPATSENNTNVTILETNITDTFDPSTDPASITVAYKNENNEKTIETDVKVEPSINVGTIDTVTNVTTTQNNDPVLDTVDLETKRTEIINSSVVNDIVQKTDDICATSVELSSLDAALDNLNDKVTSLLDEGNAKKSTDNSPDAPLDEALATLNTEVLGLLKESRKIQDELQCAGTSSKCVENTEGNKYFDYNQYRERSISPPPHPPNTYRWEDIRRDKEKGGYPWTYLDPQELAEHRRKEREYRRSIPEKLPEVITTQPSEESQESTEKLFAETTQPKLFSFDFDSIDARRTNDTYSSKSSVKNSSSGILEVLHELETEEERENENKKQLLKPSTTQSNQDLSAATRKETEPKRFALRSLLKRTHSAPKKIQVSKTRVNDLDQREKSPPQVCCHPIVEKLKTMADKQLHKKPSKKPAKPTKIKTVPLPNEDKIILAEQTRIIRLKDSPKGDRKQVAAFLEKGDSDDVVEIIELDESPSESRKRREGTRKQDEVDKQQAIASAVVVSDSSDVEPTIDELLEEEFKNDLPKPKKAPRKTKEHIYEEIEAPPQSESQPQQILTTSQKLIAGKLGKPADNFASAVLTSIFNKDKFRESLKRQNEVEEAEECDLKVDETKTIDDNIKPMPAEIIEIPTIDSKSMSDTEAVQQIDESIESVSTADNVLASESEKQIEIGPISNIAITIDMPDNEEPSSTTNDTNEGNANDSVAARKDVLTKEEKKVTFSQSTEEYQEKLAAEKGPDKEDVELPEHLKTAKRWSNMSDHEYEPIGEPVPKTERPTFKITEPEPESNQKPDVVHVETISVNEYTQGTDSSIRSITPYTDNSRTEELHTSQNDDSVIEEEPLRREDRQKKSFMTNAGEHTRNFQNKISSQASNLRTKFRRSLKSSGSNSPKERKKFKRTDITNKFKAIHMPKMSRPEMPKFKMPEKFKFTKSEPLPAPESTAANESIAATTTSMTEEVIEEPIALEEEQKPPTTVTVTTEEIMEMTTTPKKRFEFGSYPRIFNRFKSQPKVDSQDSTDFVSEDMNTEQETATQPTSASFSTHFATVPRTASKIKKSIISKWNKSSFNRSHDREESESIPQGSGTTHDAHEDSIERRLNLASKVSMEDEEEEPLGILQTKEQIQLASYDEENRAIHEISKAREHEFKARKPLTHQDSDLVSEESNRDIDWEECERMRNKILGAPKTHHSYQIADDKKREIRADGRRRNDSNFSTEETQSSGSSGDRRRTGVIEDIDDDEFFLRQRGVSQDNAEISQYISSAIRKDFNEKSNRQYPDYSYDGYDNKITEHTDVYRFDERPRKPLRHHGDGFSRSFESEYDYHNRREMSDNELPVATQYFPRHDDENLSFYDNEYANDMDQLNIMSRDHRYDSDIDNEAYQHRPNIKPEVPKRRRKGTRTPTQQDSIETNEEMFIYRSEQSFSIPDEAIDSHFISKPERKNRSMSSKSDIAYDRESVEMDGTTLDKYSPSNSRYTINIKESNGYATVKKDTMNRPPAPVRRRKRSTKSTGESNLNENNMKPNLKDSPYPDRPTRNYNIIVPSRPPRRASSSSLIDNQKPASVAASDGTQYEEIDDIDLNEAENLYFKQKMQDRPLPAPPRPPREKGRRRRKSKPNDKYDDDNDAEFIGQSFDDGISEFSNREYIGAEMATQTSLEIDDYLNDITQTDDAMPEQYSITVEDILRNSADKTSRTTSDDNLSKGIQRFRESNQRSYSERSRASTERPPSRPITPSALLIERRIARSPIQTDATLIMQPIDDPPKPDYRTDSAESEYVPYADDDVQIDTEDERIINAAIQRYQMLGSELDEHSPSPLVPSITPTIDSASEINEEDAPLPPPRRKSSASTLLADTMNVPLAQPETLSISSTQEINQIAPESVDDLSSATTMPASSAEIEPLCMNISTTSEAAPMECEPMLQAQTLTSTLQISAEMMQAIIERVRETLPASHAEIKPPQQIDSDSLKTETKTIPPIETKEQPKEEPKQEEPKQEEPKKALNIIETDEPPKRPPTPTEYTLTSDVPASFYQLRTGISDDESPALPPASAQKPRQRKHTRRCESSSEEECHRRHHHHSHHHGARAPESTIADLSGQLIRACGRALSSSIGTAGHSCIDFLRGLTKNQDEKQKDLSLVLVILIVIVASLMMLGISGDRSVHHHHWDYFNPPDTFGRP